ASEKASFEATKEYVQYRANKPNPARGHPGDPANWNELTDATLRNRMLQRQQENLYRINELDVARRAERNALTEVKRAEGSYGSVGKAPSNPAPKATPNASPAP